MKNRNEEQKGKRKKKELGLKYLTKGSTVLGLSPVHWYI